jgi:hypothetical protein
VTNIEIENTITTWAEKHSLKLFKGISGFKSLEIRCAYISNKEGECCQIWIDDSQQNQIFVHAATVESKNCEEWKKDLYTTAASLLVTLDQIFNYVEKWLKRNGSDINRR